MPRSPIPGPAGLRENLRAIRRLLDDPAPVLDALSQRFGSTFLLGTGPIRLVVVGDPQDLADVFAAPSSSYRWGHVANALGFIVGPTSMIVSDGDDHLRRRAAVQPAFARRRLDAWIPMILAEADAAITDRIRPALDRGRSIDLYPPGKDLVLAITVKAFFGNGLEQRTSQIGAMFDELQAYIELPARKQIPHRLPYTRRSRVRTARRDFDALVDREIERRRATRGVDDGEARELGSGDLLDTFVDPNASTMTAEEIHDQVNTLIGAGYNTTAATLAWTLQRALATPGVWARLRAEAEPVLGPPDAGLTVEAGAEALGRLVYTRAVVHEALRLHPAGLFAPRQAVVEVPMGDHAIPRRAMVLWSPYLAGRDAGVWADPLAFDPDRHIDPTPAAAAMMDTAWVPFGRGPRRCIGFGLAQMELVLILARMAQRLHLELVDHTTPRPHGMVVNRPDGGVVVRATTPPHPHQPARST